jgi:hypothetical protein
MRVSFSRPCAYLGSCSTSHARTSPPPSIHKMSEGGLVTQVAFGEVTTCPRWTHFPMRPDRDVLERGPRGDPPALTGLASVQLRTAWEPPRIRAVRAVWTRGGWRCYSLVACFSRFAPRAPSILDSSFRPYRSHALRCLRDDVSRRPGC